MSNTTELIKCRVYSHPDLDQKIIVPADEADVVRGMVDDPSLLTYTEQMMTAKELDELPEADC